MPLYFKGSKLHSHQIDPYRLENKWGMTVLTHNNISGHPAYRSLLNWTKYNNKNEVRSLGEYIASKVGNERNLVNTKRKINSMIDKILNHRKVNSKKYESGYLNELQKTKNLVEPLRAERAAYMKVVNKLSNLQKNRSLTHEEQARLRNADHMIGRITRSLTQADSNFARLSRNWVDHQRQIRYWQWVKNRVVPEVKRLLK